MPASCCIQHDLQCSDALSRMKKKKLLKITFLKGITHTLNSSSVSQTRSQEAQNYRNQRSLGDFDLWKLYF